MARFRRIKPVVREILSSPDWRERLRELEHFAPRQVTGPLFSLLLAPDADVRWRAAEAFGPTAARMAAESMEEARNLMRMFMWRMNEESGNLGWGIPESMACAMSAVPVLAKEFHSILASYVWCDEECDGNFLDHPPLRRGVYWGLARLAQDYPQYVAGGEKFYIHSLGDDDGPNRGLAARLLGLVGTGAALEPLERLRGDQSVTEYFEDDVVKEHSVGQLVLQAMEEIEKRLGS